MELSKDASRAVRNFVSFSIKESFDPRVELEVFFESDTYKLMLRLKEIIGKAEEVDSIVEKITEHSPGFTKSYVPDYTDSLEFIQEYVDAGHDWDSIVARARRYDSEAEEAEEPEDLTELIMNVEGDLDAKIYKMTGFILDDRRENKAEKFKAMLADLHAGKFVDDECECECVAE